MRILVLAPFAFYQQSGSSLSTYYRVKSLVELGHTIDIITYPHGQALSDGINIYRAPVKKIFSSLNPGEYKKKIIYDFFMFFKIIRQLLKNKYDLIIPHGTMYYWTLLLLPFIRNKTIPNVHGNVEVDFSKWGVSKRKFIVPAIAGLEAFVLNQYKHLICEHDSVYNKLHKRGIKKDKMSVIKMATFNKSKIARIKKNDGKFILLYTGTFVKVQNLQLIIETASLLKNENILFRLVGATREQLKYYNDLVKNKGLKNNVEIIPRKSYDELTKYYEEADIVVSPRIFGYDTPMKIIEYLNFGKCILATDRAIHTEVLDNHNAVLAEPDPVSFSKAILHLRENSALVKKYEKNSKEFFLKHFDFNIMKKNYYKLIEHHAYRA